jgi:hypothetical protein
MMLPYALSTRPTLKREVVSLFNMTTGVPAQWATATQQQRPPYPNIAVPIPPVPAPGTDAVTPQQEAAYRFAVHQRDLELEMYKEQCKHIIRTDLTRKTIVEEENKATVFGMIVEKLSDGVKEVIGRSDAGRRALEPQTADPLELLRAITRMMMGSDLALPGAESIELDERNAVAAWEALKQRDRESIEALADRVKLARATLNSAKAQLLKLHASQQAEEDDDYTQEEVEEDLLRESTYAPISDMEAAKRFCKSLGSPDGEFWSREPHKAFAIAEFHKQRTQGSPTMKAREYRDTYCRSIDAVVGRLNQMFQIHLTTPDPASLVLKFAKERYKNDAMGVYATTQRQRGNTKHGKQQVKRGKDAGAKEKPNDDDDDGGGKADDICYSCHEPGHRWADGVCEQGKAKLKRLADKRPAAGSTRKA